MSSYAVDAVESMDVVSGDGDWLPGVAALLGGAGVASTNIQFEKCLVF